MEDESQIRFLLEEYGQCFEQLRHYDNARLSVTKFAFSFYSAIATVAFAAHRFLYYDERIHGTDLVIGFLSLFAFLVGLILLSMLTRNRQYFVIIGRQINRIRSACLSEEAQDSQFKNILPTDPNIPRAFNLRSTHLLSILLICLINSVALCFAVVFLSSYFDLRLAWVIVLILASALFFLQVLYVKTSLKEAEPCPTS